MNQKHDKALVVQTGLNLFCSKGYTNVGLDEICQTTGMTKGAFYNAFGSKENFLLETLASFDKSNTERINHVLMPDPHIKAITQLRLFYTDMLEYQPQVNFMGCMVNNMMSELGALNKKVSEATLRGFDSIIAAVEPAVNQAQRDGDIDPEFDSTEIASLLHTTFYGVLTRAKSLGDYIKGMETMNLLFEILQRNKQVLKSQS